MALYGLTAVHLDPEGRIERAVVQQADATTRSWIGQAYEYEAREVAGLIAAGAEIYPVFIVLGRTVAGAKVRIAVNQSGDAGIELEDVAGRTARDLVLF
jgi:hypothetical protein